ncbi:MAG TPA: hypothetical protein VGF92_17350 [Stellaceae bacterium]|jgi:hypothetical protein
MPETLGVDIMPHLRTLDIGFVRGDTTGLDIAGTWRAVRRA